MTGGKGAAARQGRMDYEAKSVPSSALAIDSREGTTFSSATTRQSNPRCYNCHEVGHVFQECPKPKMTICYNCHQEGHKTFQCAMGKRCHICDKSCHIAKDCPQAAGTQVRLTTVRREARNHARHAVTDESPRIGIAAQEFEQQHAEDSVAFKARDSSRGCTGVINNSTAPNSRQHQRYDPNTDDQHIMAMTNATAVIPAVAQELLTSPLHASTFTTGETKPHFAIQLGDHPPTLWTTAASWHDASQHTAGVLGSQSTITTVSSGGGSGSCANTDTGNNKMLTPQFSLSPTVPPHHVNGWPRSDCAWIDAVLPDAAVTSSSTSRLLVQSSPLSPGATTRTSCGCCTWCHGGPLCFCGCASCVVCVPSRSSSDGKKDDTSTASAQSQQQLYKLFPATTSTLLSFPAIWERVSPNGLFTDSYPPPSLEKQSVSGAPSYPSFPKALDEDVITTATTMTSSGVSKQNVQTASLDMSSTHQPSGSLAAMFIDMGSSDNEKLYSEVTHSSNTHNDDNKSHYNESNPSLPSQGDTTAETPLCSQHDTGSTQQQPHQREKSHQETSPLWSTGQSQQSSSHHTTTTTATPATSAPPLSSLAVQGAPCSTTTVTHNSISYYVGTTPPAPSTTATAQTPAAPFGFPSQPPRHPLQAHPSMSVPHHHHLVPLQQVVLVRCQHQQMTPLHPVVPTAPPHVVSVQGHQHHHAHHHATRVTPLTTTLAPTSKAKLQHAMTSLLTLVRSTKHLSEKTVSSLIAICDQSLREMNDDTDASPESEKPTRTLTGQRHNKQKPYAQQLPMEQQQQQQQGVAAGAVDFKHDVILQTSFRRKPPPIKLKKPLPPGESRCTCCYVCDINSQMSAEQCGCMCPNCLCRPTKHAADRRRLERASETKETREDLLTRSILKAHDTTTKRRDDSTTTDSSDGHGIPWLSSSGTSVIATTAMPSPHQQQPVALSHNQQRSMKEELVLLPASLPSSSVSLQQTCREVDHEDFDDDLHHYLASAYHQRTSSCPADNNITLTVVAAGVTAAPPLSSDLSVPPPTPLPPLSHRFSLEQELSVAGEQQPRQHQQPDSIAEARPIDHPCEATTTTVNNNKQPLEQDHQKPESLRPQPFCLSYPGTCGYVSSAVIECCTDDACNIDRCMLPATTRTTSCWDSLDTKDGYASQQPCILELPKSRCLTISHSLRGSPDLLDDYCCYPPGDAALSSQRRFEFRSPPVHRSGVRANSL